MLPNPHPRPAPRPRQRGFTLIELMVACVIVGILVRIALPSFTSQIQSSRRIDAKGAVLDLAAREERYYAINNQYASTAAQLGYATLPLSISSGGSSTSYYQLSVQLTSTTTYFALATPTGSQVKDTTCGVYRVDQLGNRTNLSINGTVLPSAGCW